SAPFGWDWRTTGGKGGKGGNCLQESGASDSSTISIASTGAATSCLRRPAWRKLAETSCKDFARESIRGFSVSLSESPPEQNDYRTTGNTVPKPTRLLAIEWAFCSSRFPLPP